MAERHALVDYDGFSPGAIVAVHRDDGIGITCAREAYAQDSEREQALLHRQNRAPGFDSCVG
jgi:hypothetical protein